MKSVLLVALLKAATTVRPAVTATVAPAATATVAPAASSVATVATAADWP